MRNTQCRTWIVVIKLQNVEKKTQTLYDVQYGKKTDNLEK